MGIFNNAEKMIIPFNITAYLTGVIFRDSMAQ
jgi:hypothetical protein